MSNETDEQNTISRREAVQRVSALLGGIALIGGSSLMTACQDENATRGRDSVAAGGKVGDFSAEDIAFLDEVADTILPDTPKSPGAKAAKVGAFMALMVKDTYDGTNQKVFRDGMKALDDASKKASNTGFVQSTPQQRLALLETIDREQKTYTDQREAAVRTRDEEAKKQADAKAADARLPDQRKEGGPNPQVAATPATAPTADSPPHYFRMMKELALLGYFTSEVGYTKAMRYVESPGRFDPCAPYTKGEKSWAPHA